MKKTTLFLLILTTAVTASAQDNEEYKDASKESQAYHHYREYTTTPPYGLQKVKGLIAGIKIDDETSALGQKAYLSLSLSEKFTYHMIHGESFSQNCDAIPPIQDEQKKIFGQLPEAFGEYSWSERQLKFLQANKDSVVALMQASISRTHRVGLNFKAVIVEINAREMIPTLVSVYNQDKKDHDILTVLMLLMKNNEYASFMNSVSYKKLYADKESSYRAFLSLNPANEELIIQRANDFYTNSIKTPSR